MEVEYDRPSKKPRRGSKKTPKVYAPRQDFYPYKRYSNNFRSVFGSHFPRGSKPSRELYGHTYKEADEIQRAARLAARFKGEGKYSSRDLVRYGLRGAGALAGGIAGVPGGFSAAMMGARGGWDAGGNVSKFLGYGSYDGVTTNSLVSDSLHMNPQQQIAVNSDSVEGDVIIHFSEFVQNIQVTASGSGTSNFALQQFSINPGLANAFPWLSQIASNFTLYEFEGLMFQYKPTSGEYGSTNSNSLGKVIMATNYDPDAVPFANSQEMENYDYAVAAKPSCGMVHAVETKPSQRLSNQLYVRSGSNSKDKVLTDLGLFQVATEGIFLGAAGTYIIGELWVTYKIKLSRKLLGNAALGLSILSDTFYGTGPDSSAVLRTGSTLGGSINPGIPGEIVRYTWPLNIVNGYFMVFCSVSTNTDADGSTPLVDIVANTNSDAIGIGLTSEWSFPLGLNNVQIAPNTKTACAAALVSVHAPGVLQATIDFHLTVSGTQTFQIVVTQISQAMYNISASAA